MVMRKIYLLLMCIYMSHIFGQTAGESFTLGDQNLLIKECLTFKALEEKIPVEVFKEIKEYNILNHGINFKSTTNLKLNEKQVVFFTKNELYSKNCYFLFHTISIKENNAFVKYYFVYNTNGLKTTIPLIVEFKKNRSTWEIINYSILKNEL